MGLQTVLILAIVSFTIFIIYNSVAIGIFGIPWSMSKTYYLYEEKKKGLGWIFTIFMWLMAFMLVPAFLEISDTVGPWMNNFTFLAFISAAGIMFVGAAPRYKEDLEGDVHMTAAKICAAASLVWCFLVCWNIWWVPICGAAVPAIIGACTKSWKEGRDYWIEMMAFDATFATIITECILLMLK